MTTHADHRTYADLTALRICHRTQLAKSGNCASMAASSAVSPGLMLSSWATNVFSSTNAESVPGIVSSVTTVSSITT